MSIVSITKVGEATKIITDDGTGTLYIWNEGRILVKENNNDIEFTNEVISKLDEHNFKTVRFSDQTEKYGTTNGIDFVEHLIINNIFFLDSSDNFASEIIDGVKHQKSLIEFSDDEGGATTVSEKKPLPVSDKEISIELRTLQEIEVQQKITNKILSEALNTPLYTKRDLEI